MELSAEFHDQRPCLLGSRFKPADAQPLNKLDPVARLSDRYLNSLHAQILHPNQGKIIQREQLIALIPVGHVQGEGPVHIRSAGQIEPRLDEHPAGV